MASTENERHTRRPSVYLDQWVWIRLAAANAGRPREPGDPAVLEAVRAAKDAGVAFVLSATHYIETQRRRDFGDRADVAMTMAEISHLRTLRSRDRFLEHQIT